MPWCTQCFAVLLADGAAEPSAAAASGPLGAEVPPPPLPALAAAWPCTSCGAVNDLGAATCGGCGAGFLAALREGGRPALVLPVVGDVAALNRAARAGLAVAAVLVAVLLTWLLGGLLP